MLCFALLCAALIPTSALAQAYSRLQVLLPGESAAPGTITGKTGTPNAQTVGIPFAVTVRACDDSWNTVTTITNIIQLSSSDESATLPSPQALVNGQVSLWVTFNAAGSFTVSAEDQTDPTIPLATSAYVTSMALHGFEFSRINQKNQYAGQPMSITVMAVDPNDQVLTGFTGQVRLREITSYGEGRISPNVITLTNGTWDGSVTMYRADETSINRGNVNIVAFLESNPSINSSSIG